MRSRLDNWLNTSRPSDSVLLILACAVCLAFVAAFIP